MEPGGRLNLPTPATKPYIAAEFRGPLHQKTLRSLEPLTARCKCKITRSKLAARETGIKRLVWRAWMLRWSCNWSASAAIKEQGDDAERQLPSCLWQPEASASLCPETQANSASAGSKTLQTQILFLTSHTYFYYYYLTLFN